MVMRKSDEDWLRNVWEFRVEGRRQKAGWKTNKQI